MAWEIEPARRLCYNLRKDSSTIWDVFETLSQTWRRRGYSAGRDAIVQEVIIVEGIRAPTTVKGSRRQSFCAIKIYRYYRLAWLLIEPHCGGAIGAGVVLYLQDIL